MIEHRPRAHLRPETGWTNDPIGPISWAGRTHLFHQVNPHGGFWDRPHWGHVVTDDLVRWERRPLALSPDAGGADEDGCFSGCVVVVEGVPTMLYTGVRGPVGPSQQQATCLATSAHPDLDTWVKDPRNPVTTPPPGLDLIGFRDPFVWREGGRWYQLVGSGLPGIGGAVLLFSAVDLGSWSYEGPLLTGADLPELAWSGTMWECPAMLRTGQGDVLVISVLDGETTHHAVAITGHFDGHRFHADRVQRFDLGPDLYAPCVYVDPSGRAIAWGWSWEARSTHRQREDGWAGVLSLPRQLTMRDGRLTVAALPETAGLRTRRRRVTRIRTDDGWLAGGADGDAIDLVLRLAPPTRSVELRVRRAPDLAEVTVIGLDRDRGVVWLDRDHASLDPEADGGRFEGTVTGIDSGDADLRVVIDRSIIEVFVGDEATLTARVYPTRPDSTGVEVVGPSWDAGDLDLTVFDLGSVWSSPPPAAAGDAA